MVRTDGRKIVAVATLATVSVVCFAQIYLPFWADRDKIRGMAEEEDMSAAAKREIRMMEQQEHRRQQQQQQQMSNQDDKNNAAAPQSGSAGSMWKNMRK
jgi:hypothetical protein